MSQGNLFQVQIKPFDYVTHDWWENRGSKRSSDFADYHVAGKYRNLDLNLGLQVSVLHKQQEDHASEQKEWQHGGPNHQHQWQKVIIGAQARIY